MSFGKIVVATDLSNDGRVAVPAAIDMARKTGAELVLVYATEVIEMPEWSPPSEYEQLSRAALAEDRKHLDKLRQEIAGHGIAASVQVIDAPPARGILDSAERLGADLIMVGTHGRTGLRRFLLGSVAEHVVRNSSASVMVTRRPRDPVFRDHILVPTDFSTSAEAALQTAASLVEPGGRITVLHCWTLPPAARRQSVAAEASPGVLVESLDELCADAGERQGRELIDRYRDDSFTIKFEHLRASPRHGIQARLDQGDIDLVVMGSHGRRGPARWLLGSVAEATVRSSPCSVLVVRR